MTSKNSTHHRLSHLHESQTRAVGIAGAATDDASETESGWHRKRQLLTAPVVGKKVSSVDRHCVLEGPPLVRFAPISIVARQRATHTRGCCHLCATSFSTPMDAGSSPSRAAVLASKEANATTRGSPRGSPKGSPTSDPLDKAVLGVSASRSSPVADFHAKTSNLALLASMRKTLPRSGDAAPTHNAAHLSRFLEPSGEIVAAAEDEDARRDLSDDESSFLSESSQEGGKVKFGGGDGGGNSESTEGTGLRRIDRGAMANYFEQGAVTVESTSRGVRHKSWC